MRRQILKRLALVGAHMALAFAIAPAAQAQQPAMPSLVRIVVPSVAGGSTDVIARAVAAQLGPKLGITVIVENRAGASGLIGAGAVAKSPRDGSMLLLYSTSLVTTAATMRNMPFDLNADLVPVSILGEGPLVVAVSSATNIRTPADFIAAARAKPEGLSHGTGGVGTMAHVAAELLGDLANVQLKHIPYKGAAPASLDLAAGTLDAMLAVNTTLAPQIKAGRIRLVGITSSQPSPAFPGVPTIASAVPGYSADLWVAVWARSGTPPALIERFNAELNEISRGKELRELMQSDGAMPLALTVDETGRRVRDSYALWKRVAAAKNIVVD